MKTFTDRPRCKCCPQWDTMIQLYAMDWWDKLLARFGYTVWECGLCRQITRRKVWAKKEQQ